MRQCIRCGSFSDSLICKCISERDSKAIKKIQDTFRKQNKVIILCTPQGIERNGMSSMGIDLNKFAFRDK